MNQGLKRIKKKSGFLIFICQFMNAHVYQLEQTDSIVGLNIKASTRL